MRMFRCILVWAVYSVIVARESVSQPGVEEENKEEMTNNLPIKLMRDAQDYAYHANGEATEARAASHETRGKIAARRAAEANGRVKVSHGINKGYLPPVISQTQASAKSAAVAVDFGQKTKDVVAQTDALAYAAAKASAEAKVADLKAGAAAYYQELLAALHAKAGGPKNPKFAAASAAAKPYFALEQQTLGVVATYFIWCNDLLAKCKAVVKAAFGIANEANLLQAQGKSELALRKMVQAHGMIVKANEEETLAKQVYKLRARSTWRFLHLATQLRWLQNMLLRRASCKIMKIHLKLRARHPPKRIPLSAKRRKRYPLLNGQRTKLLFLRNCSKHHLTRSFFCCSSKATLSRIR